MRFFVAVRAATSIPANLLKVIDLQSSALGLKPGASLTDFNTAFLDSNAAQPDTQLAAAETLQLLAPERKAEAVKAVAALDPASLSLVQVTRRRVHPRPSPLPRTRVAATGKANM